MGKASSSKKVARAARAGSSSKGPERRALGFPLAIVAVLVLGTGLVVFSRDNRDEAVPPQLGDHWHAAFGIWNCDEWAPQVTDAGPDLNGIHTHDDSIIHIHPANSSSTGTRATLARFFETTGIDASDSKITLPDGTVLDEAAGCNGDPATLKIARWPADQPNADPEIVTDNLKDIRLRQDREAFTVALVRDGESIPRPESIPTLDNLSDVEPTFPRETTTVPPSNEPSDENESTESTVTTTSVPGG